MKQKDGSDKILGQGSNEDPKLAHEEAALKARVSLLGNDAVKNEKSKDEEKYLITIETVVAEPEIKDACGRLHQLQKCIGL